jgi:N-acetylglucosamine-6-phosphate deacetylase
MGDAPRTRTALSGGRLVLPDGTVAVGSVVVEGDRIRDVSTGPIARAGGFDGAMIDASGYWVTSGLIDVHMHGACGHSFDEEDRASAGAILRYWAARGVTTVQASLVSASTDDLERRVAALAPAVRNPVRDEAMIAGIHLEGPFLSPAQRGAHRRHVLRSPSDRDRAFLLDVAGLVTMVTAAPELPGVLELASALSAAGVVMAAGHSDAPGALLEEARRAGFRHLTHLWSGQSALTREGPWRVPGLLEASLASTGLTAEVIADGKHLPAPLLEIARRCIGTDLVVVSDATAGTGMPDGYAYRLGDVTCHVDRGVGMVDGEPSFGGSTTGLDAMLRFLAGDLGWPVPEVVAMMTSTPARVLGMEHRIGAIARGLSADLVLWADDLVPELVMLRGRLLRVPDATGRT